MRGKIVKREIRNTNPRSPSPPSIHVLHHGVRMVVDGRRCHWRLHKYSFLYHGTCSSQRSGSSKAAPVFGCGALPFDHGFGVRGSGIRGVCTIYSVCFGYFCSSYDSIAGCNVYKRAMLMVGSDGQHIHSGFCCYSISSSFGEGKWPLAFLAVGDQRCAVWTWHVQRVCPLLI